jgi:hypothetical protein
LPDHYCTVRLVVAPVICVVGEAIAIIVVEPVASAFTETITLVLPDGMTVVAGTVATAVLLEARFTVKPPAGAGADKSSSILACLPAVVV